MSIHLVKHYSITILILFLCAVSGVSADIVVTNNHNDGVGSLRQAFLNVRSNEVITFALPVGLETITLESEIILKNIGINIVVDGGNKDGSGIPVTLQVVTPGVEGSNYRLMSVTGDDSDVSFKHLVMKGGDLSRRDGGYKYYAAGLMVISSRVVLEDVEFRDCYAREGGAARFYYAREVIINNCRFINNGARTHGTFSPYTSGGAISNIASDLTIDHSLFSGNSVESFVFFAGGVSHSNAKGGAIRNAGTAKISHTTIENNTVHAHDGQYTTVNVRAYGGGIYNSGVLELRNSSVIYNNLYASSIRSQGTSISCESSGGGIYNDPNGSGRTIVVVNSTIAHNTLSSFTEVRDINRDITLRGGGAGIYGYHRVAIINSSIMHNSISVNGPNANQAYTTVHEVKDAGVFAPPHSTTYLVNALVLDNSATINDTVVAVNDIVNNASVSVYSSWFNGESDLLQTSQLAPNIKTVFDQQYFEPLGNHGGPTHSINIVEGNPGVGSASPVFDIDGTFEGWELHAEDGLYHVLSDFSQTTAAGHVNRLDSDQRGVYRELSLDMGAVEYAPIYTFTVQTSLGQPIDGPLVQKVIGQSDFNTVTAVPDSGHIFKYWANVTGDSLTIQNPLGPLLLVGDSTVVAQFERKKFTISTNIEEGDGVVDVSSTEVFFKDSVSFTVTPGYALSIDSVVFNGINITSKLDSLGRVTQEITQQSLLQVYFYRNNHTVILDAQPGTIQSKDTLIQVVPNLAGVLNVEPVPPVHQYFTGWLVDGVLLPFNFLDTLKIMGDSTITAVYENNSYTIAIHNGDNGTIIGDTLQELRWGDTTSVVTAVAKKNYHFEGWYDTLGVIYTSSDNLVIDSVSEDVSLYARYVINPIEVSITAVSDSIGGATYGVDMNFVTSGDTVSFYITPDSNTIFTKLIVGDSVFYPKTVGVAQTDTFSYTVHTSVTGVFHYEAMAVLSSSDNDHMLSSSSSIPHTISSSALSSHQQESAESYISSVIGVPVVNESSMHEGHPSSFDGEVDTILSSQSKELLEQGLMSSGVMQVSSSSGVVAPLKEGLRVRPTLHSVPFIYREGKANVLTLNPETLKYRIVSPDGTLWQSGVTSGSEADGGVVPVQSLPTGFYLLIQE